MTSGGEYTGSEERSTIRPGKHLLARLPAEFREQFELEERLGTGASAQVYRARQRALDRVVVVKLVPGFGDFDPAMQARILQEVRLVSELSHPHLVRLLDHGQSEGMLYLISPFEEGETVHAWIESGRTGDASMVERVLVDTLLGLEALHLRSIIHRDLKPENILIVAGPSVRILDLGLAKDLNAEQSLTGTGGFLGTPVYMSPQQAEGHRADPRDDLYSLGVVAYEMMTGVNPFRGATLAETFYRHQTHQAPCLGTRPGVPPALGELVDRLLGKRPQDRPVSARDALDTLALAGLDVSGSVEDMTALDNTLEEEALSASVSPDLRPTPRRAFPRLGKTPKTARGVPPPRTRSAPGAVPRSKPRASRDALAAAISGALGMAIGLWLGSRPAEEPPRLPLTSAVRPPPTHPFDESWLRDVRSEIGRVETWFLGPDGDVALVLPDPFANPPRFLGPDPLRAGKILAKLPVANQLVDWVVAGGDVASLPASLVEELRAVDSRYRGTGAPRPFFPFLYLEPSPEVAPLPPEFPDPGIPARGWLDRALISFSRVVETSEEAAKALRDPAGPLARRVASLPVSLQVSFDNIWRTDPVRAIAVVAHDASARIEVQRILEPAQAAAQEFLFAATQAVRRADDRDALVGVLTRQIGALELPFHSQLSTIPARRVLGGSGTDEAWVALAAAVERRAKVARRRFTGVHER